MPRKRYVYIGWERELHVVPTTLPVGWDGATSATFFLYRFYQLLHSFYVK